MMGCLTVLADRLFDSSVVVSFDAPVDRLLDGSVDVLLSVDWCGPWNDWMGRSLRVA